MRPSVPARAPRAIRLVLAPIVTLVVTLVVALAAEPARAGPSAASPAATIVERLGATPPLDAPFRDHDGRAVRLGDVLGAARGRPVLLGFMYHRCAMLCSTVLDALVDSLAQLRGAVGVDFSVVTISLDPRDGPDVAARKRAQLLARYRRPSGAQGWSFLVGDAQAIARVAAAVGFGFARDPETEAIAHPAALIVLGPDARVVGYLYGVELPPRELERAWMAAADGARLPAADRLLLACERPGSRADERASRVVRVLRLLAVGLVVGLAAGIATLARRRRI